MHRGGRFVEACLLCLLREGETHGYNLMEKLIHYGFVDKDINISIIYRALRNMETELLVTSTWQESDQGPNKRLYSITAQGLKELDNWIVLIKKRRKSIDSIISMYEKYNE